MHVSVVFSRSDKIELHLDAGSSPPLHRYNIFSVIAPVRLQVWRLTV